MNIPYIVNIFEYRVKQGFDPKFNGIRRLIQKEGEIAIGTLMGMRDDSFSCS